MELIPLSPTAKAPAESFTGDVYVTPAKKDDPDSHLIASTVRFTPGARTNWHSHANGQALLITEGAGVVVARSGQVIAVHPGETVWTPPGEEHWHGAGEDTLMAHVAMLVGTAEGDSTTWLEPVSDDEFHAAHS